MQYQAPADLLKEKTILITGAGDGIGKAAAKSYAAHGATVILLGRTVHKLEQVYDEIITAGSAEPVIHPLDLEGATPKDYENLASILNEQFGALHGLLHNAAFSGASMPLQQYDAELWYKVMQVNLNAPFLLTQAVLPLMIKSENAAIIFTIDKKSTAYWGAYGISKAALISFMEILADEMDSDNRVKVNAINPGPVRTAMRTKAFPAADPNEMTQADDIMDVYLYLMGKDNNETGKIIEAQK